MKTKSGSNIAAMFTKASLCRRRARRWLLAISLIMLSSIRLVNAQGITYSVNTTSDTVLSTGCSSGKGTCTLRAAIQAANSHAGDDGIRFNLPAGAVITLAAALPNITDSVTIDGGGTITISGNNAYGIFYNSSTLTLRNLTLTNGFAADGGGAIFNLTTLNIDNCKLVKNVTGPNGIGGAILTQNRMTISNSEFAENRAKQGGAIYARFNAALVNITGSNFHHNRADSADNPTDSGGALYIAGGTTTLQSSTVSDNTALGEGGGICVESGTLNLTNVTLSRNEGKWDGGGIGIHSTGSAVLTNVAVADNKAFSGGGIFRVRGGDCTLTNVTLSNNEASGEGGGIRTYDDGTGSNITLTNVTLSGNRAYQGGGIVTGGGDVLTNVTLSNNTAVTGGGIYIDSPGPAAITFKNTLIAKGYLGSNCVGVTGGTSTSSLSDDDTCGFGSGGDNRTLPLGPLADNGGFAMTHLPARNSHAIDGGTNTGAPATDQRGVPRPQGTAVDVGAVELAPADASKLANISTRLRSERRQCPLRRNDCRGQHREKSDYSRDRAHP